LSRTRRRDEQWDGRDFFGTHNLLADPLLLVDPASTTGSSSRTAATPSTTRNCALLPKAALAELHEEVEMAKGLCAPFDLEFYRVGHLTPVYFRSGLNNFGVRELLRRVAGLAPAPRPQPAEPRPIPPEKPEVVGFVFRCRPILTRNTAIASPLWTSPPAASSAPLN
jgi:peptide chain release factor 3